MATILHNTLSFAGLVVGVPSVQAHGLVIEDVGIVPDMILPSIGGFTVIADATNVTVTRLPIASVGSLDIYVGHMHSTERVISGAAMSVNPFVVNPGATVSVASPERTLSVSPSGADYSTIEDAITAANALVPAPSLAAPAVINVYPGVYVENNPLVVPEGVGIVGIGNRFANQVVATTPTAPIFTLSANSLIRGFWLRDADGVGGVGVYQSAVGEAVAREIHVSNCTTAAHATGAGVKVWAPSWSMSRDLGETLTTGFFSQAGAKLEAINPHIEGSGAALITTAFSSDGAGSELHAYSGDIEDCVDAFLADNGGSMDVLGGIVTDCTNNYHIGPGGGTARIHASGVGSDGITGYGLWVEHVTGQFRGNGVRLRTDQLNIIAGCDVLSYGISDSTVEGEHTVAYIGSLDVGLPGRGYATQLGEGGGYIRNMAVLRNDNLEVGAWTDITAEMKSFSGSTAAGFSGIAAGNCLYIGALEAIFPSIRTLTTVAMVIGAGTVVLEYWNGAAWTAINYMAADAQTPLTAWGQTAFQRAQSEHVRWKNAEDMTGWVQKALNGITRWWVRFRITVAITSVPTLEQIKLGANRTKFNPDGVQEFFGTSRRRKSLVWHKRLMSNVVASAPGSVNWSPSANIALIGDNNRFVNGTMDGLGGVFTIPEGLDTSLPLTLQWTWSSEVVPVNPSAVEFEGHFVQLLAGDLVNGTKADTPYNKIVQTGTIAQYALVKTSFQGDVSQLKAGELVAFTFFRDASGGNPDDTLAGNIRIHTIELFGYFWR